MGRQVMHRGAAAWMVALLAVGWLAVAVPGSPAAADVAFVVGGSVNQVFTHGHAEGTQVELLDAADAVVAEGVADAQGAKLFKEVPAGAGYTVRAGGAEGVESEPVTVLEPDDHPDQAFYDGITLSEGYGYLPTRDGTLLSVNVTFPKDGTPPPWPVLMDYSGYDPSQPGSTLPQAATYSYRGYVTVGVNMRGTTCSGGAFDFFEPLQQTDGYDAVEALAAQSWSNGDVGLVGISYSGYSQLYVAATQPPSLRAITPLSPYADTYRSILYPGGIRNSGFALEWATDRANAARPRAQAWVRNRIDGGDTICRDNQVMRLQSRDLLSEIPPGRFDESPLGDYLDTTTFVDRIEVPIFLAAQFQDEQTGGHAAELATILGDKPGFKATFANGAHADPLGPQEYPRVMEFVDFYVGRKIPALGPLLRVGMAPELVSTFENPIELPVFDRFTNYPDFESALAAYEAEPPIRIRWQTGAVKDKEGSPYSTHQSSYDAWPIPSTIVERLYLQPDGGLSTTAPTTPDGTARASSSYLYDPSVGPKSTFGGGSSDMWKRHPDVRWPQNSEPNSVSFTTPSYATRTAYAGTGSVDLWVRSTEADTDLEATLTEVRADGHEVFIQNGWLRASRRAMDPVRSTVLQPYQTHDAVDAAPLPAGEFTPVRFEVFPFAHVVPPGSKLRLTIDAPGGNQPYWEFDALPGGATNEIAHSVGHPSSVVLPRLPTDNALNFFTSLGTPNLCVVEGVATQSVSLRNQWCRADHPSRRPTGVAGAVGGTLADPSIDVSWTAPPTWADGTAGTVTGYQVTVSPGDQVLPAAADATTVQFADAVPGTDYTFTVRAMFGDAAGPASSASPVVAVPELPAPSDAERFLTALYPDLLGRSVDPASLAFWSARIDDGVNTRGQVTAFVSNSDEYRRKVVRDEYQLLLDRAPDAAGLANWVAQLRTNPSVDRLRSLLIGSGEFWTKAGATPDGFVDRVYDKVLGRTADAGGRAYMKTKLAAGATRGSLGEWLVATNEADTRLIKAWYDRLLHRAASGAEAQFWATRLRAGRTEASILAELTGTTEYLNKA